MNKSQCAAVRLEDVSFFSFLVNSAQLTSLEVCHETLRVDRQWLCDHHIKFARWQHPVLRHGERFVELGIILLLLLLLLYIIVVQSIKQNFFRVA